MQHFITEFCNFFLVVISFFILAQLYRVLKFISSPKTYKGKILCSLISLYITSSIVYVLDQKFDGFSPEWLSNYFIPYTLVAGSITTLIILYIIYKIYNRFNKRYSLNQLDRLEGHRFEYACADILKMNGFKNVKVTQGSGDYGVDIIAYKNGKKYAVQCKRYSHKLDNKPIQEVKAGLAYYHCDIGAVMTNQYFTEPAKELARINSVKLWDRNALSKMLRKTSKTKTVKEKKTRKEKRPSFPPMTISDPLTREAIEIIATNQNADTDFIQRKLRLGYPHAESILSEIESLGMIGPQTETGREIRITAEDLPQLDIKNKA